MNAGSVCSGVGGIDLGLERAGMRVVFQCEKDAYRRAVLARHWPGVPCFEDIRDVQLADGRRWAPRVRGDTNGTSERPDDGCIDLLCGGTPCQDLSVAGRRAGITGERSGLFFEFARIADELVRPAGWLVFENVPGLLSSSEGRDFAVVLATLADIGFHDLAYRVLDSRYFGVPQRRRRVFIVARRASGRGACEVLLEPESGGGDFAPSREARSRVAASLTSGSHGAGVNEPGRRKEDDENIVSALDRKAGGADDNDAQAGHLIADLLTRRYGKGINTTADDGAAVIAHTLRSEGFDASEDGTGRGTPLVGAPPHPNGVRATAGLPRRVDDPPPDGPRYSACGDAVTVNVAQWLGERIVGWEAPA